MITRHTVAQYVQKELDKKGIKSVVNGDQVLVDPINTVDGMPLLDTTIHVEAVEHIRWGIGDNRVSIKGNQVYRLVAQAVGAYGTHYNQAYFGSQEAKAERTRDALEDMGYEREGGYDSSNNVGYKVERSSPDFITLTRTVRVRVHPYELGTGLQSIGRELSEAVRSMGLGCPVYKLELKDGQTEIEFDGMYLYGSLLNLNGRAVADSLDVATFLEHMGMLDDLESDDSHTPATCSFDFHNPEDAFTFVNRVNEMMQEVHDGG